MAPQTITAPSQNNHMLKGKTTLVAGATSDSGHNGFDAADDIEVPLRNLTERHGVVLRRDAAIMSLPTAIEAMMQRAPKKFGSVDLITNDAGIEHVTPIDKFSVGRGKQSWAQTLRAQSILCVWHCWGRGPEPSGVSAFQRDLGSLALGLPSGASSLPTRSEPHRVSRRPVGLSQTGLA